MKQLTFFDLKKKRIIFKRLLFLQKDKKTPLSYTSLTKTLKKLINKEG